MKKLYANYSENIEYTDRELSVEENFDLIKKKLFIGSDELTFYFIDGFIKDTTMEKLMTHLVSLSGLEDAEDSALRFAEKNISYVEVEVTDSFDKLFLMFMSGAAILFGSKFGGKAIIIDARKYPSRSTEEPENDRVMRGSHDGFVETLINNTALIRRRIRDTNLKMICKTVGSSSKTDIAVCYISGKANKEYVDIILGKISNIKTEALSLGHQSLAECLIRSHWYNPLPKIRYTERPDVCAAQLLEGSIIIICDNSPEVMLLPTSIFDFTQETNDFYFPPLTGTYIRILRNCIFFLTLLVTPIWFLMTKHVGAVPSWLLFSMPKGKADIPIIFQLFLVEFAIDGLKLASMNTPNLLSNSLSVIGGLILGDYAVEVGWLLPEVILYMSFVAIANFSQPSYELGYAFKFFRMFLLILIALFDVWGFAAGCVIIFILLITNRTVFGKRGYLYPLVPFDFKALLHLIFRFGKACVEKQKNP